MATRDHLLLTLALGTEYGRQKMKYLKVRRNAKMQLGKGNILAMIHMPVGIKTLQLIKHLRRHLVPLLHWPYAGQSKTC